MEPILVIIPFYNGDEYIHSAIESIYGGTATCDILLIDNNSNEESAKKLKQNFPATNFIHNNKNIGFGAAVNQGFEYGGARNYKYYLVLNQDVELLKDTVQQLKELADTLGENDWIWLSPSHLGMDRKTPETYFYQNLQHRAHKGPQLQKNKQLIREVDFINAACWFINPVALKKLRGFDKRFFMYGEDLEFCNRSKFYGLKMYLMDDVYCIHNKVEGDYENNPDKLLALTIGESLAWYCRKDISRFKKLKRFIKVNLACIKLSVKGKQNESSLKFKVNLAAALRSF